ncbi:RNA-dependent ATPase, partial [Schaereria dolodes]|nr:RNA-dependent ATPase [Schaereria dolodes]
MAKRNHDESADTNSVSFEQAVNGSLPKKRKIKKYEVVSKVDLADAPKRKLSKEERKELKKLKKERHNGTNAPVNGSNSDLGLPIEGDTETATLALPKAQKAQSKEVGKKANDDIRIHKGDKTSAKSTKKTDKAQLKGKRRDTEPTKEVAETVTTNDHMVSKETTLPSPPGYQEDPSLIALEQSSIDTFLSEKFITITDPASSKPLRPIISFSQLPPTVASMKLSPFSSFKSPTPIQSAAWPFALSGRDVIGVAETGSGKTLAFGVPCIRYISTLPHHLNKDTGPTKAVIVSPTRELACQIHDQIVQLATPAGLHTVCVYGGVAKDAQRQALKMAHIIVATPGRLNDLINEGSANLSSVGYLVLDEADRMLDKGFEDEIRKIISNTPSPPAISSTISPSKIATRQTLMFTATWPPSVRDLAATFMHSPVKITIGENNPSSELRANARITQLVEVVDPHAKETRLLQLLKKYQSPNSASKNDRILVFCLYKKEATRVENFLRSKGLRVAGIHGDLSQEKRTSSLEAFKRDGGVPLLVATDVAARGLDIPNVKVVINVTFPLTVEDYVHRIG